MLGESRLNVYILGADLTPRQQERVQAQMQTALRSLPAWAFQLLTKRIEALGVPNVPLIIEPQTAPGSQVLSLGNVENRPAVRLLPRLRQNRIDWGQDRIYLLAKAVAYMAAPASSETGFWTRWAHAVARDQLRDKAQEIGDQWQDATDLGLLFEMFAAYALTPDHERWSNLPHIRSFLDDWRSR